MKCTMVLQLHMIWHEHLRIIIIYKFHIYCVIELFHACSIFPFAVKFHGIPRKLMLWGGKYCKLYICYLYSGMVTRVYNYRQWLFYRDINSSPPGQNGRHFGDDNLVEFLWMKSSVFWLKFHCSLFLMVQLAIIQHWFRAWPGAESVTSHLN